jgi:hypothetical protein
MKLLVFAQTPPPHHGQSAMIRLLLEELGRPGQGFELHHVNLRLSENAADVGRWRLSKIAPLLAACLKAWYLRWRHGPMAFYYVPAPAKRGALYRDWVVMALALLHARTPGAYRLTVAGAFDSEASEAKFKARARELPTAVRFVGFAELEAKRKLFTESDVLCFPTYNQTEGQPLVLIEALAHDVPIVTTKWRAIPSMLPRKHVWYVDQRRPDQIAESIFKVRQEGEPNGILREHYLLDFTPAQHITALRALEAAS